MNEMKIDETFERVSELMSDQFSKYGYRRMKTAAFQPYELYEDEDSFVNRKDMVKVIDSDGEVLVLRPDVTIPITKELSHGNDRLTSEHRFYYLQEVFRKPFNKDGKIEKTQAGVEYFCESSPEADAETIALALHTLKELSFSEMKIEIGHTVFFNELLSGLRLTDLENRQIKEFIQAKNITEISLLLDKLGLVEEKKIAIEQIPFLYGKPKDVLKKAWNLPLTEEMAKTLSYLEEVYRLLSLYGWKDDLTIDFGLINYMHYYSGILFQGFVEQYGKPVLMGGRYDFLGKQFGADLPAIGFACEVESIVEALGGKENSNSHNVDLFLVYDSVKLEDAIHIADTLRKLGYRVLSVSVEKERFINCQSSNYVRLTSGGNFIKHRETEIMFYKLDDLLALLKVEGDVLYETVDDRNGKGESR